MNRDVNVSSSVQTSIPRRRRSWRIASVLLSVVLLMFGATINASATAYTQLGWNKYLNAGDALTYGHYDLVMQADGDLVEHKYPTDGTTVTCFSTRTYGNPGARALYALTPGALTLSLRVVDENNATLYQSAPAKGDPSSYVNLNAKGEIWVGGTRIYGGC